MERVVSVVLLVCGLAGLAVAVAVAAREAGWGLSRLVVLGTVGGGLAWAALFLGVAMCLDLLVRVVAIRAESPKSHT